ncbi:MAG: hypothetical protein EA397_00450 [Deltaproteobacteria bacterium]|nr:MAG: hypothetical protein EA397_00450 [Deltaproteobacteria bacterium]
MNVALTRAAGAPIQTPNPLPADARTAIIQIANIKSPTEIPSDQSPPSMGSKKADVATTLAEPSPPRAVNPAASARARAAILGPSGGDEDKRAPSWQAVRGPRLARFALRLLALPRSWVTGFLTTPLNVSPRSRRPAPRSAPTPIACETPGDLS